MGWLVTPDMTAVIFAVPAAMPVANPPAEIVAVPIVSLAHVTWELMFAVDPSEYVAVAINCWVEPTAKLTGEAGVTVIEDNVTGDVVTEVVGVVVEVVELVVEVVEVGDAAATTAKLTDGLVMPDRVAEILAVPAATPVARPVESMVTIPVVSVAQVTSEVMSILEPFEYVPVAVNGWVEPTTKLAGDDGVTAIEDSVDAAVDVDVDVDEQAAMDITVIAIIPIVR